MTVLEFIKLTGLKDFYCESDIEIGIHYQSYYKRHGEMIPKKKTDYVRHSAINLCHADVWEEYKSYNRFANREIVKIRDKTIYTKWTVDELKEEFIKLSGGDERCKVLSIENVWNYCEEED